MNVFIRFCHLNITAPSSALFFTKVYSFVKPHPLGVRFIQRSHSLSTKIASSKLSKRQKHSAVQKVFTCYNVASPDNIARGRQTTFLIYAFSSIFFDRISTISSFSVPMHMATSRTLDPTLQLRPFSLGCPCASSQKQHFLIKFTRAYLSSQESHSKVLYMFSVRFFTPNRMVVFLTSYLERLKSRFQTLACETYCSHAIKRFSNFCNSYRRKLKFGMFIDSRAQNLNLQTDFLYLFSFGRYSLHAVLLGCSHLQV